MDPDKRTKIMLEEARRKVIEHERWSRANQGKSQIPLKSKLRVALPLTFMVVALYSFSFFYRKTNSVRSFVNEGREPNNQVSIENGDNEGETVADMEYLDDSDKKW